MSSKLSQSFYLPKYCYFVLLNFRLTFFLSILNIWFFWKPFAFRKLLLEKALPFLRGWSVFLRGSINNFAFVFRVCSLSAKYQFYLSFSMCFLKAPIFFFFLIQNAFYLLHLQIQRSPILCILSFQHSSKTHVRAPSFYPQPLCLKFTFFLSSLLHLGWYSRSIILLYIFTIFYFL